MGELENHQSEHDWNYLGGMGVEETDKFLKLQEEGILPSDEFYSFLSALVDFNKIIEQLEESLTLDYNKDLVEEIAQIGAFFSFYCKSGLTKNKSGMGDFRKEYCDLSSYPVKEDFKNMKLALSSLEKTLKKKSLYYNDRVIQERLGGVKSYVIEKEKSAKDIPSTVKPLNPEEVTKLIATATKNIIKE